MTDNSNNHVLAIDYRGFGKSTGIPSESGLINDGAAAVDWAMKVAKVPASQIVILGQSLGTAVTSGVAEHFAMQGVEFAGVIMVASFSNLPTLLSRYSAAGFIPVLSPVRAIPPLMRFFQGFVVDKWQSDARLATLVGLTRTRLRLTLIHAKNDVEIPCSEDDALFRAAAGSVIGTDLDEEDFAKWKEERTVLRDDGTFVATVKSSQPDIVIREELVPYGGKSTNAVLSFDSHTDHTRSQRCDDVLFSHTCGHAIFWFGVNESIVRSRRNGDASWPSVP